MRRLLAGILVVTKSLLALLAIAAIVFWIRSSGQRLRWMNERYDISDDRVCREHRAVWCWDGRLVMRRGSLCTFGASGPERMEQVRMEAQAQEAVWKWRFAGEALRWTNDFTDYWRGPLGFEYLSVQDAAFSHQRRGISIPFWLIAIVCAAWPLASFALFARRRATRRGRLAAGLCVNCGYDVRATPERCPECGVKVGE